MATSCAVKIVANRASEVWGARVRGIGTARPPLSVVREFAPGSPRAGWHGRKRVHVRSSSGHGPFRKGRNVVPGPSRPEKGGQLSTNWTEKSAKTPLFCQKPRLTNPVWKSALWAGMCPFVHDSHYGSTRYPGVVTLTKPVEPFFFRAFCAKLGGQIASRPRAAGRGERPRPRHEPRTPH